MVYFIQSEVNGFIKIGFSNCVEDRIRDLQITHPKPLNVLASVPGDREDESLLHILFVECCVRGEWFRPTAPLLGLIARVNQTGRLWPSPAPTGESPGKASTKEPSDEPFVDSEALRTGAWVSFREAAVYLGISQNMLRRRVKAGIVEWRKIYRPDGPEWRVWLPPTEGSTDEQPEVPEAPKTQGLAGVPEEAARGQAVNPSPPRADLSPMDNGATEPPRAGRWVSMREAAVYLGIWEGTIRKRVEGGLLEGKKIGGPNGLEWRIWLPSVPSEPASSPPEGPPEPPSSPPEGSQGPDPEGASGVSMSVYLDLLTRHEQALMRLGYLQAEAARLPALTEGAAASAARAAELEARAKDAERELLRAAALHAAERRRGQAWAVGAIVLAAVLGIIVGVGSARSHRPGAQSPPATRSVGPSSIRPGVARERMPPSGPPSVPASHSPGRPAKGRTLVGRSGSSQSAVP